ncbi:MULTISPECIES: cofactor-independent phosphoglycerate mutase [Muribaculum]|uniref:cofactor-independent phosphoglycerate mutase n=7 Tax=Muribaculaceae TaxID=2005473 RepID=UPI00248C97E8|nr:MULTISPECIES: cofactor-independent phosphoglycerate mutase [Muribaculum]MCX4277780.1 cofactor-independent phosphoglycerate mutase [Muribaculum sp.]
MKYIVVLGDGMADEPIPELGGKTPLEAADTPVMDMLARKGRVGRLVTVPEGFHPGSEIANLSVLGYNVPEVFEGRGVLEAANMGVDIKPGDMAMRCNLICISDGRIKNHSGGHISTEEAHEIIATLQQELGDDTVHFYPGVSYRHLLILKGGDKRVSCTPPHDVPGTAFADVMVKADVPEAEATARKLNELIMRSQKILESHPVNLRRKAEGKDCANSIWPWSPGYRPSMRPMTEEFGIKSGVVISAVDLIFGIGVYAGLKPVYVEGATGLYDTNYEGKAQAAIDALRNGADFVFLHVEASDEAGHEGDYELKKRTIEYLDNRILRPLMDAVSEMDEPVAVAVLPDHPTPCRLRTHTSAPVPFLIYRPGDTPDDVTVFSEESAADGGYGLLTGSQFIKSLIK